MVTLLPVMADTLAPLTTDVGALPVLNRTLSAVLLQRLACLQNAVSWRADFWPDTSFLVKAAAVRGAWRTMTPDGTVLASVSGENPEIIEPTGLIVKYPWHVLQINEELVNELTGDAIAGQIVNPANFTKTGFLVLGEGSRILPGVFIEGNAVIGSQCKIGPNCYIRGNTVIGDNCHVGQSVEIKNAVLCHHVSAGHLSYIGDSVVDCNVNFGAGTIISNYRHDKQNHSCMIHGQLINTGRRKFGAIIGARVHTGIHTSIYPGRMIAADSSTLPGEIVRKNIGFPEESSKPE